MGSADAGAGPLARAVRPDTAAVRRLESGVASLLEPGDVGAPYDRRARTYDRLVTSGTYNRFAWATSPADYRAFASEGIGSDDGPLLDVPCGTASFTAEGYRSCSRDCGLVDRSVAMLEIAAERLGSAGHQPERLDLVQADLFALPFREAHFSSILLNGALHLFEDLPQVLGGLNPLLRPGGSCYASGLVAARPIGSLYLKGLHRAGEVAKPRSEDELRATLEQATGARLAWRRVGCMVFVSWSP